MHHRSHDQGGLCPGGVLCPGVSVWGSLSGGLSRGVGSLVQGIWGGGFCPGGSLSGRPPYGNARAICILLECVLVTNKYKIT